jgi:hypothetical protein
MCKIGSNSTSGATFNVNNELGDHNFLKDGVTSTKLRRLVPFSVNFHCARVKLVIIPLPGETPTSSMNSATAMSLKVGLFPRNE